MRAQEKAEVEALTADQLEQTCAESSSSSSFAVAVQITLPCLPAVPLASELLHLQLL